MASMPSPIRGLLQLSKPSAADTFYITPAIKIIMGKPQTSSIDTKEIKAINQKLPFKIKNNPKPWPSASRKSTIKSIAVLGNYLPRQCGIATFTVDLCNAISGYAPDIDCQVIAMNDKAGVYDYPSRVQFEIDQNSFEHYQTIADRVNNSGADVLSVQHEFGIFGGDYGSYLLEFLNRIELPISVTLHTVLQDPPSEQRRILQQIAQVADRLVVMGKHAAGFLSSVYEIPKEKIVLIPHGIPEMGYMHPDVNKNKLELQGNQVVLTFGLLSPGKGIEYMVDAMPKIVQDHPNAQYIVLGLTHPHVKAAQGEDYRESLKLRADKLGVGNHIQFIDKFLTQKELHEYIGIADVFVTPYLNEAQITSGVLSYGLGMGKAIVSTPYWHAKEALDNNRGILVPFKSGEALATEISGLLEDEDERRRLQLRAYQYSRRMVWNEVAHRYLKTFEKAVAHSRLPATRPISA